MLCGRRNQTNDMTPEQALKLVNDLERSEAWGYIKTVMQDEIILAATSLASQRNLPAQELHYQRGAMWAAQKLLQLPELLKANLEGDLLLQASKEAET